MNVFGGQDVGEKERVPVASEPQAPRNPRRGDGGGGAPGRIGDEREVVSVPSYRADAAQHRANRRPRVPGRDGPERIGRDHGSHMGHERADGGRVSLAPEIDRCAGKGGGERRRQ